ncbi:hypothetical protein HPP92_022553 [Vanilla planifolia]|nr:hypothetical protein HPP92_022553 [Vanilla planifolia]
MKRASMVSVVITTFFYLCCGCFGYAAFGNDTPGNLLTGFGFYEPYWLVDLANACIILHLLGAYQVFSQLIFAFAEKWYTEKFPRSWLLSDVGLPFGPPCRTKAFRLCFRTLYVASTTGLALAFPYFNQFLGLLGALSFWPLTVYLPVEMYFVQRKVVRWSSKWLVLQLFSAGCLLVSLLALVGSIEGIFNQRLN